MKITPRPIDPTDEIDKSRDIAGFNKWARSSRTIGFLLFILGWFTIPAEVLLRRDFGQRWFTAVNFYTGLLLLVMFAAIQAIIGGIWGWLQNFIAGIAGAINPFYTKPEPSYFDMFMDRSMLFVILLYILLGSYHRFKIWWRIRTNTNLHSYDDGTSRLEPLAGLLMRVVNLVAVPFVWFYRLLIPRKQRKDMPMPKLVNDRTAFANAVVEPLVLFTLAFQATGTISVWLFITAIALAIHAHWKETAKLTKILDFRDSMIEAQVMMQLKEQVQQGKTSSVVVSKTAVTMKDNLAVVSPNISTYPNLAEIIEEMNRDGGHWGN